MANTTTIKTLQNLIVELTKYEPNLTMKIWKMIAPPRHRLNQDENVKIVSLMPNPVTTLSTDSHLEGVLS